MVFRIGEPIHKLSEKDDQYLVQAKDVKGGYLPVQTQADRNALPDAIREDGLIVYVRADKKEYRLEGGIANSNWVEKKGGSGGGGQDYLRDMLDVQSDPVANLGVYQGHSLRKRIKAGKNVATDGVDAFEYVAVPMIEDFRYLIRRGFTNNQGYGGASTNWSATERALEVAPTSAQPSVIYLNQHGIGDPSAATNSDGTNSYVGASSIVVFDLKRSSTDSTAPVTQEYELEFFGKDTSGASVTKKATLELFSLPSTVNELQTVTMMLPTGFANLWKVEISKGTSAKGTASKGLFIRFMSIESEKTALGQLTPTETHRLRHLLQFGEQALVVYDTFAGVNTTISANDGRSFLITKDEFDNLVGLTTAQKTLAGEAGLFVADATNNRWRIAHVGTEVRNAVVMKTKTNTIDFFDNEYNFKRLYPQALSDLSDFAADTAFPHTWDQLVFRPNADYTSGEWVNIGNPVAGYFKATSFMFANVDFQQRVITTAGTQAGAGTPNYDASVFAVNIDVRKDTKMDFYLTSDQSALDLAVPGDMFFSISLKAKTDDTNFAYKVTIQGKDTRGNAKVQSFDLEGTAYKTPRWFSNSLDADIKEIDAISFESVTGKADALAQNMFTEVMAIVDPGMVQNLPQLGQKGATTLAELQDVADASTKDPDEWALMQFRPDKNYSGDGVWESIYNPITLMFKAGTSFSSQRSYNSYITFTKGSDPAAGDSSYANKGIDLDVSKDSEVEIYFRKDKQYQDLSLAGGMIFAMFGFSATEAQFKYSVAISGKDASGNVVVETGFLSGKGDKRDQWFPMSLGATIKEVLKVNIKDAGEDSSKAMNFGAMAVIDNTALRNIPDIGAQDFDTFVDPGTF